MDTTPALFVSGQGIAFAAISIVFISIASPLCMTYILPTAVCLTSTVVLGFIKTPDSAGIYRLPSYDTVLPPPTLRSALAAKTRSRFVSLLSLMYAEASLCGVTVNLQLNLSRNGPSIIFASVMLVIPISLNSAASLSWKVFHRRSMRPFASGVCANTCSMPSSLSALP